MQLFPTNCKLLVSCRALGACEGCGRQKCKDKTIELVAQAYCCPLSFYIDHRYRSQRAAGSTKIVARFLFIRLDLLPCLRTCADAITAEFLNNFGPRISSQCRRECLHRSPGPVKSQLCRNRPFDLKAESAMQICSLQSEVHCPVIQQPVLSLGASAEYHKHSRCWQTALWQALQKLCRNQTGIPTVTVFGQHQALSGTEGSNTLCIKHKA